jgi:ribosome-binding factor A
MPSRRIERVRELVKRALGEAIRREIPVSTAGLISVNDVEVSGDLRIAKVFVSVLGGKDQQKSALNALEQNRPHLQELLAKSVVLKFTPQLRFVMDDSIERGNRVLRIMDELERAPVRTDPDEQR